MWHERLWVQVPLFAQKGRRRKGEKGERRERTQKEEKKKNVESEKTGTIERIEGNYEKSKRGKKSMEIGTGEREMVHGKNLDPVDPSMGEI